jgi:hypothetical protein
VAFARGKNAWGISDRSGFRYKLNEMKVEWTGMRVGPDEFETKHPQLEPRKHIADAQALRHASPDRPEALVAYVGVPLVENVSLKSVFVFSATDSVTVAIA